MLHGWIKRLDLGGVFLLFFLFFSVHPYLGKIPNLGI